MSNLNQAERAAPDVTDKNNAPQWGPVRTVADMVRNLLTLAQDEPIHTAFHVDYEGERRCRTRPVSISRERVIDGKWVDPSRKDVPYANVVWASQDERALLSGMHPAWAVLADNGNIIIWSRRRAQVEAAAALHGKPVVPILAPRAHAWSADAPTEQGLYWHWSGDHDQAPFPLHVLWSGTSKTCFISRGQVGEDAVFCDKYGGYWMRIDEPDLPETLPKKGIPA